METMSRGGASLPTSLSGVGLAHVSAEVTALLLLPIICILRAFLLF